MELRTLGSSSAGNCYILDNGTEALVIEAGVSFKQVKTALRYDLSKVCGCIVSHQHNDHAKYIGKFTEAGIPVLALSCVFGSHGIVSPFALDIEPGKGYKVGRFKVIPFNVKHDVPCVGYLVSHPDMGRLLFVTDTMSLDYRFTNIDTIMIEANYADDILQSRIDAGEELPGRRDRLFETHMELETTKRILKAQDLSQVDTIVLIHLSDSNSDEERFMREVRELTGKIVVAANKDMALNITKLPF